MTRKMATRSSARIRLAAKRDRLSSNVAANEMARDEDVRIESSPHDETGNGSVGPSRKKQRRQESTLTTAATHKDRCRQEPDRKIGACKSQAPTETERESEVPVAESTTIAESLTTARQTGKQALTKRCTTKPRARLLTFPDKLMELLNHGDYADCLSWLPDGEAFACNREGLERTILPLHFGGTKFASFTRKLNRWGFKRYRSLEAPEDTFVYAHRDFKRDSPELCSNMAASKQAPSEGNTEQQSSRTPMPLYPSTTARRRLSGLSGQPMPNTTLLPTDTAVREHTIPQQNLDVPVAQYYQHATPTVTASSNVPQTRTMLPVVVNPINLGAAPHPSVVVAPSATSGIIARQPYQQSMLLPYRHHPLLTQHELLAYHQAQQARAVGGGGGLAILHNGVLRPVGTAVCLQPAASLRPPAVVVVPQHHAGTIMGLPAVVGSGASAVAGLAGVHHAHHSFPQSPLFQTGGAIPETATTATRPMAAATSPLQFMSVLQRQQEEEEEEEETTAVAEGLVRLAGPDRRH